MRAASSRCSSPTSCWRSPTTTGQAAVALVLMGYGFGIVVAGLERAHRQPHPDRAAAALLRGSTSPCSTSASASAASSVGASSTSSRPGTFVTIYLLDAAQLPAGAVHPARPAAPCPRPGRAARRRGLRQGLLPDAAARPPAAGAAAPRRGRGPRQLPPAQRRDAGLRASRGADLDRGARLCLRCQHRRHRGAPALRAAAHRGQAPHARHRASWPSRGWWRGLCSGRRRLVPGTVDGDGPARRVRRGLRSRRDDAPADERRDGQRPRARPPARPLQRAQLADVLGRLRRRTGRLERPRRPRPGSGLRRLPRRRLRGARRHRARRGAAPAAARQRRARGRSRSPLPRPATADRAISG